MVLLSGAAQSACDQSQFASIVTEENEKVIIVQNRTELNDYTTRPEAFRQAQLEAISLAAYCNSMALSAHQVIAACDFSATYPEDKVHSIENYALRSYVICVSENWLYVRSEITVRSE